jgi:hypothetical protein
LEVPIGPITRARANKLKEALNGLVQNIGRKMDLEVMRRQLFFDKSFFSSLENHGREIIAPTHTHTKCGK